MRWSFFARVGQLACVCVLGCLGLNSRVAAQSTSIYNASYDGTGAQITNATAVTLNTFTVTGIFEYTTQVTVFVTDGTATGRIFGFTNGDFTTLPTVGESYTDTVTAKPYQGVEELTATAALTDAGILTAVTPISTTMSQVSNTSPIAESPSDPNYAATGNLLLAPVTFSITPTTSGTLSTTASTVITDTSSNLAVTLYRSATAFSYTAGQTYKVVGYEQPYNSDSEIVGVNSMTQTSAVPEPSTYALVGIGAISLGAFMRRRSRAHAGV